VTGGFQARQEFSGASAGGAKSASSTAAQTLDTTAAQIVKLTFQQGGTANAANITRAFQGIVKLEQV
jgi:hypothetical protein